MTWRHLGGADYAVFAIGMLIEGYDTSVPVMVRDVMRAFDEETGPSPAEQPYALAIILISVCLLPLLLTTWWFSSEVA